jgi:hypothetical protein
MYAPNSRAGLRLDAQEFIALFRRHQMGMDPATDLRPAGQEIHAKHKNEEEIDDTRPDAQRRARRVLRPVTDSRSDLRSDPLTHFAGDHESADVERLVAGQHRRVARNVDRQLAGLADQRHGQARHGRDEHDERRDRGERHRHSAPAHDRLDAIDQWREHEGDHDAEHDEDEHVRELRQRFGEEAQREHDRDDGGRRHEDARHPPAIERCSCLVRH